MGGGGDGAGMAMNASSHKTNPSEEQWPVVSSYSQKETAHESPLFPGTGHGSSAHEVM
jgi:hypothetical protein